MMTPEEFFELMKKISEMDIEDAHSEADQIMSDLLIELGYEKGIEVYNDMEKWYA